MKKAISKKFPEELVGVWMPNEDMCPRGLTNCSPLSFIVASDGMSFVCCGQSDEKSRALKQDRFRLCDKNADCDNMNDLDEQDMFDLQSIVAQAISVDWHLQEAPTNTG